MKNVNSRFVALSQVEIRRPDGKFRAIFKVIQASTNFNTHPLLSLKNFKVSAII